MRLITWLAEHSELDDLRAATLAAAIDIVSSDSAI
jgi:hypothetical protein